MPTKSKASWQESTQRIIAALDIVGEYEAMGLVLEKTEPSAKGYLPCYAMGRDDKSPSACINVFTGRYKDSGGESGVGKALSFFDFAVQYGGYADFKAARAHFASKAGVDLRGRPPKDPADLLDFVDWNDALVGMWCSWKPPITIEAAKLAGCRLARYPKKTGKYVVLAMPVYGPKLLDADPVSYILWNISGGPLLAFGKRGEAPREVKMKSLEGCDPGMMNLHALGRLEPGKNVTVWKVEGPSDVMSLLSIIPPELRDRHLVVTNSAGAVQNVTADMVRPFTTLRTFVIHDADEAGEMGAAKWCIALRAVTETVYQIRLPYSIEKKNGKDLRDWIAEGHTFADLLELSEQSILLSVQHGSHDERQQADNKQTSGDDIALHRKICETIGIDVLGESHTSKGTIDGVEVFSHYHHKTVLIPDATRLSYHLLLQIGGPPILEKVAAVADDQGEGMVSLNEVKEAISLLAGFRTIHDHTKIGVGCWQGKSEDGSPYPGVVLVSSGEAAEWNGHAQLDKISYPRCRGHLLDLQSGSSWYHYDTLSGYLAQCDQTFAQTTCEQLRNLFTKWRWKSPIPSPVVLTGLVLATWVQSIWNWRPQVFLNGPTKAGKTTLLDALAAIFGGLAVKSSHSTAAGIRQEIHSSSKIILCDEAEQSKGRAELFQMIRASSRGDKILRGTTNQRGQKFGLQHIVWFASIENGMTRAPDLNRFIFLELLPAIETERGKLTIPPYSELADLGQRLLAVAIKSISAAQPLAVRLKCVQVPGVDDRVLESYAVPAAMLATAYGYSDENAAKLMQQMLLAVEVKEQDIKKDEHQCGEAIFSAQIQVNGGMRRSVAQLLDPIANSVDPTEAGVALATNGVKEDVFTQKDSPELADKPCLVLDYVSIKRHLLKGTEWEHQKIQTLLLALPGAKKGKRRIGGRTPDVILIPRSIIDAEFLKSEPDEPSDVVVESF